MKLRMAAVTFFVSIILGGCASPPQKPIEVSGALFVANAGKVGVAVGQIPKVDTQFPGADCLLCLAAASVGNSKLTDHVRTLSTEDVPKIKDDLVRVLRARGVDAVLIAAPIDIEKLAEPSVKGDNVARRDFASLKSKLGVDKLLVVETTAVGVWRNYSAYIPTEDPKAVFIASGYLVNLSSNVYEWYLPVKVIRSADQQWDEPPKFPGITNAYFQAIETGKDELLQAFGK